MTEASSEQRNRTATATSSGVPKRPSGAPVEDASGVRADDGLPVLVGHAGDQPVARDTGVVDEDVELAGLLDESTCLVTIRDVGVNGPRARFPRHLRGLVLPRAVAERD